MNTRRITDEEIWQFWLGRINIHNGELKPQLVDFARAVIAYSEGLNSAKAGDPVSPVGEVTPSTCKVTRVSVDRFDRGFTYCPTLFKIKLNGEEVSFVITADVNEGFVLRYVTPLRAAGGHAVTEVVHGKVEILFADKIAQRVAEARTAASMTEVSDG